MSTTEVHRPSSARRKYLRDSEGGASVPMVSNFFPLERYYDASEKVLASFTTAYEHKELDEAYVYGLRYCTFCLEGLKQHDYYNSSKFKHRRMETNRNVQTVVTQLEQVAEWMDVQELERQRQEALRKQQQEEERQRKIQQEQQRQFEELQQRIERQKNGKSTFSTTTSTTANTNTSASTSTASGSVEQSAFAKLQRLRLSGSQVAPEDTTTSSSLPPPMVPPPLPQTTTTTSLLDPPTGGSSEDDETLPPPVPPPSSLDGSANAPPSYNQALESSKLGQHSYFGPGTTTTTSTSGPTNTTMGVPAPPPYDKVAAHPKQQPQHSLKPKQPKKTRPPPIRTIIQRAHQNFAKCRQDQTIQISALQTYQGRIAGSINGCTVISALVASMHLKYARGATSVTPAYAGVTESDITRIIDRECVPLLRAIRSKLDLSGSSLIIPSDVHDHMVDHKLLYQHKFVGAAGGNILDPNHVSEVFKLLQYGGLEAPTTTKTTSTTSNPNSKESPPSRQHLKAAATLFYHEHVISIVKFPTSPTEAIYDFIDSLPSSMTRGNGKRTRCHSIEALAVQLEYYACTKLSESNQTYIDRNGGKWDDAMADFDPRVFQAFVWTDLPPPPKQT